MESPTEGANVVSRPESDFIVISPPEVRQVLCRVGVQVFDVLGQLIRARRMHN